MFLHALNATKNGYKNLILKANDTDVVILAIYAYMHLQNVGLQKLWVSFGKGQHARLIPIHETVRALGEDKALVCFFFTHLVDAM